MRSPVIGLRRPAESLPAGTVGLSRLPADERLKHHARVYVDGDVHTQTIDGFFGLFKSGVRGAHHAVSHKWLQGYLNEWTWRYNRREDGNRMFRDLIETAATPKV